MIVTVTEYYWLLLLYSFGVCSIQRYAYILLHVCSAEALFVYCWTD